MISSYAMSAMLVLALCCAACGTKSRDAHASPVPAQSPAAGTSTATATTNTAIPAALPTLPAAPRYFTEGFDTQPPQWVFAQADNGQTFAGPAVRDGFLVFDMTAANEWGYAIYNAASYTDVMVETQVQSRTAGDGAGGLICDYDEAKGWYEFNIFADQSYQLLFGQWLAPGIVRYTPLYQGESRAIRSDVNDLALQCQGSLLAPSINGEALQKWSEQRFELKAGKIGLSAASFTEVPFSLAFDWVKVSKP
jgi:hypothetical protein